MNEAPHHSHADHSIEVFACEGRSWHCFESMRRRHFYFDKISEVNARRVAREVECECAYSPINKGDM